MSNAYESLFDFWWKYESSTPWNSVSTPTQIAQWIQYQFDPQIDEKDFFISKYDTEYWWVRISNGRYIIRQKNNHWSNDLILHDGTKEICRMENIILSANWNKEVINGKTWLCVSRDRDINSTDDELLINWICVDELDQYNNEYRFMNVTWIVKVCKKDPSHDNSEIAYFLTDHWFPKSFFQRFLDLWENFHEVVENWLPKFETKDLIKLFIQSGEYEDQHFVVRIENGSPEYIPGKIVSTENIGILHDSLVVIEDDGIKNVYSMRSWTKAIYTNIDHIETEVLSWEKTRVKIIIHLPDERYDVRIAQYNENGIYEITNTK